VPVLSLRFALKEYLAGLLETLTLDSRWVAGRNYGFGFADWQDWSSRVGEGTVSALVAQGTLTYRGWWPVGLEISVVERTGFALGFDLGRTLDKHLVQSLGHRRLAEEGISGEETAYSCFCCLLWMDLDTLGVVGSVERVVADSECSKDVVRSWTEPRNPSLSRVQELVV